MTTNRHLARSTLVTQPGFILCAQVAHGVRCHRLRWQRRSEDPGVDEILNEPVKANIPSPSSLCRHIACCRGSNIAQHRFVDRHWAEAARVDCRTDNVDHVSVMLNRAWRKAISTKFSQKRVAMGRQPIGAIHRNRIVMSSQSHLSFLSMRGKERSPTTVHLKTTRIERRGYIIAALLSGQHSWTAPFLPECQIPLIMPTFRARRPVPARVLATGAA